MPTKPRSIPSPTKVAPAGESKAAAPKASATVSPAAKTRAAKAVAAKPAPAKAVAAKPRPAPKVAAPKAAAAKAAAPGPATSKRPAVKTAPVKPAAATPALSKASPAKPAAPAKVEAAAKPAPVPAPTPVAEILAPAAPLRVVAPAAAPAKAAPAAKASPEVTITTMSASIGLPFVPTGALPKAMQDFANTGLDQAREAYQKARTSAETLTHSVGSSGEAAAKGVQDFSRTMLDAIQANTDATLGFLKAMSGVRSLSEAVELQARHARTQFESVTEQAKTLAGIANRTMTETAQPVRHALDQALKAGR